MQLISITATANGPEILYRLLQERSTEEDPYINISHRSMPTWAEHLEFIARKFYRYWWLIDESGITLGSLSVTWRNEIGIVLFKEHRGNGHGKAALRLMMDTIQPMPAIPSECVGDWVANVHPENIRSIVMFEQLGFEHVQNTYVRKHG